MTSWHTCKSPRAFYRGIKVLGLEHVIFTFSRQCKMDFTSLNWILPVKTTISVWEFSFIHILANSWATARLLWFLLDSQCVCVFSLSIHILYLYEVLVDVFCPLFSHWEVSIFLSIRMPCFLNTAPFPVTLLRLSPSSLQLSFHFVGFFHEQ